MTNRKAEVKGLADLRAVMLGLPRELRGRPLKNALFAGAVLMRDEARRLVPRGTGKLWRNITTALARREELVRLDEGVVVTVRKRGKKEDPGNAYYAPFVEFGHRVRPKKGDAGTESFKTTRAGKHGVGGFLEGVSRTISIGSRSRYGRSAGSKLVQSQGIFSLVPARPFMRPAFESKKFEAVERIRVALATELRKAVVKLRKKGRR